MNGETKREKKNGGRGKRRGERTKKRKKEKDVRWDREGGEHCLPIKIRKSWGDGRIGLLTISANLETLSSAPPSSLPLSCLFLLFPSQLADGS